MPGNGVLRAPVLWKLIFECEAPGGRPEGSGRYEMAPTAAIVVVDCGVSARGPSSGR